MPQDENAQVQVQQTQPDGKASAQPQPAVQPLPTAQPAAQPSDALPLGMRETGDKVQVLDRSAFKRLREEARERGKRAAQAELEQKAKAAGFDNFDALLAAATAKGKPATPARPARPGVPKAPEDEPPAGDGQGQPGRDSRKVRERYEKMLADERKQRNAEVRKRKQLETDLEAERAYRILERTAYQVGIRDTDYAIRLYERHVTGKSDDELEKINEVDFFQGLREQHPYLWGETVRPATTGVGAPTAAPPRAGDVSKQVAQNGQVDARKMNTQEYQEHLRKRGLSLNG